MPCSETIYTMLIIIIIMKTAEKTNDFVTKSKPIILDYLFGHSIGGLKK
jgi:hypothetical protein